MFQVLNFWNPKEKTKYCFKERVYVFQLLGKFMDVSDMERRYKEAASKLWGRGGLTHFPKKNVSRIV